MKKLLFLIFFLILVSPFGFINSQTLPIFDLPTVDQNTTDPVTNLPLGVEEQISTEVSPKTPAPGEQVKISVESFSTDLDKANFNWTQDGSTIQKGKGIKSIFITAPNNGNSTTIRVSIEKEGGGTISETFTIAPAEVDIIWEARTYTPPYYKGKSLFTSEADVRLIAMPNFIRSGSLVDPSTLDYKWSINGSVIESLSGYGKRVVELKGNLIQREVVIKVEVTANNSNLKAVGTTKLDDVQPEVILYENNPLLGVVFEKAVNGKFVLDRPEIELQAIPYFFSTPQKENGFTNYSWRINGNLVEEGVANSFVRFRNESGEEGQSTISVDVEHFENILQAAKTNLNLKFEEHEEIIENGFEF